MHASRAGFRGVRQRQPARWSQIRLVAATICVGAAATCGWGAALDASRLPPASTAPVDYARDIQPLLERSCLRCHGPEKPKSNFRLDRRETALKGGDHGVAIVVSNSAASPLIQHIARLKDVDEDLWMPPAGKAPALSPAEVALMRAWVDQGLPYGASAPTASLTLEGAPTVGGAIVKGNARVFQEHRWMPEGWNGGLERFELLQQVDERTRVTAAGRLLRDDYRLTLQLDRQDLGFVRGGFEQYRKYYADTGGYFSDFSPSAFTLDRDLHLDLGRSWVDVGLTLPHWPRLTLGYEHQYKQGEKSLTSWSPVIQADATRNLFPTSKSIDEETHRLKFNLDHEIGGVRIEDDFRGEWTRLRTSRTNDVLSPPESDTLFFDRVQEGQDHFQAANAVRMERQFTPWFFGSGGYLYSHFDAEGSFSLDEIYVSGTPGFARRWRSPAIVLERDAHVGNLNGQFGPWDGFTASLGIQSEWNRQRGFGDASFDYDQAGGGFFVQPTIQSSAIDRAALTEHVGLRYARIPRTVLFAEGRLQQESLGQFEEQPGGDYPLRRDTDASSELWDFRGGFNTSPWRKISLSSHYRRIEKRTRFDHRMDVVPSPFGDFPGEGYSAFIRDRDTKTDEVEARLSYHWTAWLKTAFSYRLTSSEYWTATDPVAGFDPVTFLPIPGYVTPGTRVLAGNYNAHIYSVNAAVRPVRRLSLNTTFSFHDARTVSEANGVASVAPYRGQTHSVLASGNFAWNARTDLLFSYGFSDARYGQDATVRGLPGPFEYEQHGVTAGLRRRISEHVTAALRYGFFLYDEPSSGGFNDYTAHMVFATVNLRLP